MLSAASLVAAVCFTGCGKKSNDPALTPADVKVTGVTVAPTTLSLNVGGSETLTATIAPETATNKTVTWSSDKTDIATVN